MTNVAYPRDHVTAEEARAQFEAELAEADRLAALQAETHEPEAGS